MRAGHLNSGSLETQIPYCFEILETCLGLLGTLVDLITAYFVIWVIWNLTLNLLGLIWPEQNS